MHVLKRIVTISNLLTVARIFFCPFIVHAILHAHWTTAIVLVSIAGISDGLDGFFARLLGQETWLGKMLDPIADKILLLSCFASLAWSRPPGLVVPQWFVLLLSFREATIVLGSLYVLWFARRRHEERPDLGPTIWGKLTTCMQLLFITWLLLCYIFSWAPAKTYGITFAGLVLLSVASFVQYVRIGVRYVSSNY